MERVLGFLTSIVHVVYYATLLLKAVWLAPYSTRYVTNQKYQDSFDNGKLPW